MSETTPTTYTNVARQYGGFIAEQSRVAGTTANVACGLIWSGGLLFLLVAVFVAWFSPSHIPAFLAIPAGLLLLAALLAVAECRRWHDFAGRAAWKLVEPQIDWVAYENGIAQRAVGLAEPHIKDARDMKWLEAFPQTSTVRRGDIASFVTGVVDTVREEAWIRCIAERDEEWRSAFPQEVRDAAVFDGDPKAFVAVALVAVRNDAALVERQRCLEACQVVERLYPEDPLGQVCRFVVGQVRERIEPPAPKEGAKGVGA